MTIDTSLQVINPAAAGSMDILRGMLLSPNNARYRAAKSGYIANGRKRIPDVYKRQVILCNHNNHNMM